MKKYVDKIKDLDYKQLMVEHSEKAVFGIVALCMLAALTGTSWSRYERQPKEFMDRVTEEDKNLLDSAWPAEMRDRYNSMTDVAEAVEQLTNPLDIAKFDYGTPFIHPLYKPQEKIREPEWLPVEALKADYSYAIFEYRPEEPEAEEDDSSNNVVIELAQNDSASVVPIDPNAPRPNTVRRPSASGGGGGSGATVFTEDEEDDAASDENEDEGAMTGDDEDDEAADDTGGEDGEEGYGGDFVGGIEFDSINAEGRRFVAIRGVVPLKEQLDKLALALNASTTRAGDLLEYIDFELQRQTAVQGPDPWGDEWESVDLQVALDVLDTVDDFDPDVVSSALTDAVFTMPLPRRLAGAWDTWGGHPKFAILSKEQREQEVLINEKSLELAREKLKEPKRVRKGGFASRQNDLRGTRRRLGRNMQDIRKSAAEEMNQPGYRGYIAGAGGRGMNAGLHALIVGRVLLFRYLDFAIEPGNAYRYRVRLTIRNPNYRRPIDQLVNPDIANEQIRFTPWSNLTDPVLVPTEVQVYLTKVSSGTFSRPQPTVNLNIFDWYAKAGTHIIGELRKVVPGQFVAAFTAEDSKGKISGGIETTVLRPANRTLQKEKNIELVTKNVLLDIKDRPVISEQDHQDLELDPKRIRDHLCADQVIVVDQYGKLVTLDNGSQEVVRGMQQARQRIELEKQPWLQFVTDTTVVFHEQGGSALDDLLGDDDDMEGEGGIGGRRSRSQRRRSKNPLYRKR